LGPVFCASDSGSSSPVAVKLFRLDLSPERVHQLVAALDRIIAAHLAHPALAVALASGVRDGSAFLAQEYVEADSLDLVVREFGPAPPADALRVAAQLAGALDFAAVVNVCHGALHPRDVLLSSDETRLTGIGIAQALDVLGFVAPVRRPYSAPERIAGGAWDRRADVFSLAAVIHELLWGRPISGVGVQAVESLTPIEGGDLDGLRATFARALAKDPGSRFDTALDFAQSLQDALPDVEASPMPPPRSNEVRSAREEAKPQLPVHRAVDQPAGRSSHPAEVALPFALGSAETERYQDVEIAPAIVEVKAPPFAAVERAPERPYVSAPLASGPARPPAVDRSRSRSSMVVPLALALIVGMAVGFASGYRAGMRDRPAPSVAAAAPPEATPALPPPREFTETAVAPAPVPAAAPASVPEAPVPAAAPPPPPETAAPKADTATGRLLVRSTPAGARVFIDSRDHGRTPVAVRDLSSGAHRLRVLLDGYAMDERRVVISPSRPAQSVTIELARLRVAQRGTAPSPVSPGPAPTTPGTSGRFTGILVLDSRPPGAKIFLDGTPVGTTPMLLPAVRAGEHAVRMEHDGYRNWSSSVRVVASERNRVTASLEK